MRKRESEKDNHERWLVSYADFITLLFAFFVVMYAISAINLEKYRAVSNSLEKAFAGKKNEKLNVPDIQPAKTSKPKEIVIDKVAEGNIQRINQDLTQSFAQLIQDDYVNIRSDKQWTEIEIKSNLLFESGSAEPNQAAMPLLKALANVLKRLKYPIVIEGHTDNVPIFTDKYPSNWELSAARAAAILRVFIDNGVEAKNLSAVGFAEQHPIAENTDEEGRNKNRRVLIVIAWSKEAQEFLDPEKRRAGLKVLSPQKTNSSRTSTIDQQTTIRVPENMSTPSNQPTSITPEISP